MTTEATEIWLASQKMKRQSDEYVQRTSKVKETKMDLNKMTKAELIKALEGYGIKATTRARKATLIALLEAKMDDCCGNCEANTGCDLDVMKDYDIKQDMPALIAAIICAIGLVALLITVSF